MHALSQCDPDNHKTPASGSDKGDAPSSEQEPKVHLPTPHRLMAVALVWIWSRFGQRRRQFYLAGFLTGVLGAVGVILEDPRRMEPGFPFWLLAGGGALGVGAVWLVLLIDRWQSRLDQDREAGRHSRLKQAAFVVLSLFALLAVAVAVAGVFAVLTR